jgi:uncharacterized lipoprotein YddW (UPF0748 family)
LLLGLPVPIFSHHSHQRPASLRTLVCLLIALAICRGSAPAQSAPPPKREVRSVWITTATGLDWPRSTDRREQQNSLRAILQDLHRANFNTIFFQVRARADAYYRSKYEPWPENLTGTPGKDPGWDPLDFLLQEAHALGIEVHAWFNVFKVRGPNPFPISSPLHITRSHPQWTIQDEGEVWLDPGIPAVRQYLIDVATDLIRNYPVDGINFDFLRYPGRTFADQESYRRYGGAKERDAWRRSNVDAFVEEFASSAAAIRPMLKLGCSPFGVYDTDTVSTTEGSYSAVYQDSEGWLRRNLLDYLSPQVYWDIGSAKGNPDFAEIVQRWQRGSNRRHIYAGIGAYKQEILRELPRQIDCSREAGNQGQSFYRLENVRALDMFAGRYATPALIPPMSWKDSIPPLPPSLLAVAELTTNIFTLEWTRSPRASDGDTARFFIVYRSSSFPPRTDLASNIVAVVPAASNYYLDTVRTPTGMTYYYAVTALDKGNIESSPSLVGTGVVRELLALQGKLSNITSLSVAFGRGSSTPTLLAYRIPDQRHVLLEILKDADDGSRSVFAVVVNGKPEEGTHIVGLAPHQLPAGDYTVRLRAGETTVEHSLTIRP